MGSIVNLFESMVAVNISVPANSGNGSRLSLLIAQGTVLTPTADLPSYMSILSATVDNGGGITGSSPLTRFIAGKVGQAQIENHGTAFNTDFAPTMPQPVSRATGTAFLSIIGLDGVKRTYARSSTSGALAMTALCMLMPTDITSGN